LRWRLRSGVLSISLGNIAANIISLKELEACQGSLEATFTNYQKK